jgi:hypothetical protein
MTHCCDSCVALISRLVLDRWPQFINSKIRVSPAGPLRSAPRLTWHHKGKLPAIGRRVWKPRMATKLRSIKSYKIVWNSIDYVVKSLRFWRKHPSSCRPGSASSQGYARSNGLLYMERTGKLWELWETDGNWSTLRSALTRHWGWTETFF